MQTNTGVSLHRFQNITRLISDRLKRCADDVVGVYATGQAEDGATCIRVPVRCTQASKCRNDVHAVGVFHFGGEILRVECIADEFHFIAQPLNGCASHKYRTFQRVVHFPGRSAGDGGQQSVFGLNGFLTGIHQHEAAGTVSVFRHPFLYAQLAKQSCLLVTGDTGDRNTNAAFTTNVGLTVHFRRATHFWQHGARNIQRIQHRVIPVQGVDVEQHGT